MRVHPFTLLAPLVLAGCASVIVTPAAGAASYPPKEPDCAVELWPARPARAYDELGEVKVAFPFATGEHGVRETAADRMQREACKLGADAVVDIHDVVGGPDQYARVGTAIRYRGAVSSSAHGR